MTAASNHWGAPPERHDTSEPPPDHHPSIAPMGETALIVTLGVAISETAHARVRALCARLDAAPVPGMTEYVPAYTTVTVFYDPVRAAVAPGAGSPAPAGNARVTSPLARVRSALAALVDELEAAPPGAARTVEIPVCYGGDLGPDLDFVARHAGLTPDEVVAIHTAGDYLVHMIGFAPGFPYLGGMSPRIAAPRRPSPRVSVPAGSVGIAGGQTGVYPLSTPGGWQLIGQTPVALFRPTEDPPTLLRLGDRVRFVAIGRDELARLAGSGAAG